MTSSKIFKEDLANFAEFLKNEIPKGEKPPHVFTFRDSDVDKDKSIIEACLKEMTEKSGGDFHWSKEHFDRKTTYDSSKDYGSSTVAHYVKESFHSYTEYEVHIARKEVLDKFLPKKSSGKPLVEHIAIAPAKSGNSFWVAVNKNYKKPFKVQGSMWLKLYKIARKEPVSETDNPRLRGNFNHERKNKLYTRTGCKPTKILETEQRIYKPAILIDPITFATLKRRAPKDTVLK